MKIEFAGDDLVVNGHLMRGQLPPEVWYNVLGLPDRIYEGPTPAPVGHRNNQAHIYDRLGIKLNEHHATCLVQSFSVFLHTENDPFYPSSPYTGTFLLEGVQVHCDMREFDFVEKCRLPLQPHIGHAWFIDLPRFSVDVKTWSERLKSGRKSEKRFVEYISFRCHKSSGT